MANSGERLQTWENEDPDVIERLLAEADEQAKQEEERKAAEEREAEERKAEEARKAEDDESN